MSKKLRAMNIKQPPRLRDEAQSGNPSVGIAYCPKCNSAYEKKSWKHAIVKARKLLYGPAKKNGNIKSVLCPACRMAEEHLFEGEIIITNVPSEFLSDLRHLILRFAENAKRRSPLHRLLKMERVGTGLRITTTENQLAGRLAKKIVESFKHHVTLNVVFSREPYEKEFVRLAFAQKGGVGQLDS